VNRSQRRSAAHAQKKTPSAQGGDLVKRSRFESDLRKALSFEGIDLISTAVGEDHRTGEPTWVFCLRYDGAFVYVNSPRGNVAEMATGLVRVVREAASRQAKGDTGLVVDEQARAAVLEAPLSFEEKVRRAEEVRCAQDAAIAALESKS